MLKIGDTVKVIAATDDFADSKKKREYIPIGTVCEVTGIGHEIDGSPFYEIQSMSTGDVFLYSAIWKKSLKRDIWNGLKMNETHVS